MHKRNRDHVWKNIAAGAIGGLAASWVMNQTLALESKLSQKIKRSPESPGERAIQPDETATAANDYQGSAQRQKQQEEPTTLRIAEIISWKAAHHELTDREKKIAEPVVHYTFGTLMGGWYGVLSELTPAATLGRGTAYGAAVWLGADEIALSALKLARNPFEYPISTHVNALGAHVAYGITMDTIRRGLLRLMGARRRRQSPITRIRRKFRQKLREFRRAA